MVARDCEILARWVSDDEIPDGRVRDLDCIIDDVIGEGWVFGRLEIYGVGVVSQGEEVGSYDGGGFTGDEYSHE